MHFSPYLIFIDVIEKMGPLFVFVRMVSKDNVVCISPLAFT